MTKQQCSNCRCHRDETDFYRNNKKYKTCNGCADRYKRKCVQSSTITEQQLIEQMYNNADIENNLNKYQQFFDLKKKYIQMKQQEQEIITKTKQLLHNVQQVKDMQDNVEKYVL